MIVMPSCHGSERFRQVRLGVRVRVRLGVGWEWQEQRRTWELVIRCRSLGQYSVYSTVD